MNQSSPKKVAGPTLARRFIDACMGFLGTLVSDEEIATQTSTSAWLVIVRQRYVQAPETLSAYRAQNPDADAEMLRAIECLQLQQWVYLKDTSHYSVWLDESCEQAYGVLGLTQAVRDLMPGGSGVVVRAGLMSLGGRWVTDGLFDNAVWLGPGYLRDFTARYQRLRQAGRFSLGPVLHE